MIGKQGVNDRRTPRSGLRTLTTSAFGTTACLSTPSNRKRTAPALALRRLDATLTLGYTKERHAPRRIGRLSPSRMFRVPVETVPRSKLPPSWRDGRWRTWEENWEILGPGPIAGRPWAIEAAKGP